MDPETSRLVGPYRLVASLGRGGQAEVYLAVRRGPAAFSKLVVLKSIRHEMERDPRWRNALIAEARLAAKIQHPNVVQTLEVGDDAGQLYMAMEFLDGQPLSRVAREAARAGRPLSLPVVAEVVSEMLSGLHAAHELRDFDGRALEVIHRDLSPQNVFLTYQGEVKLIDFGIAKAATSEKEEATEAGVIKGKASYMAPEQALGQPLDRRVDVYAAGIVAWELLSRQKFAPAAQASAAAQAGAMPPLGSDVPPAVARVIERALARDRDQRFATAREMRDALDAALAEAGVRRAGRDELGRVVTALFEKDRAWLQERIRQTVAAADQETPSNHTLPTVEPERPTPTFAPQRRRFPLVAAIFAGIVALGAALAFALPAVLRAPDLRLCGSNTIGEKLAPALVEGFKRRSPRLTADIANLHTTKGFAALAGGKCDVAMASRPIHDGEAQPLGDLRSPATEHVIALDAIAVIVHPDNPVRALDTGQVEAIFTGKIRDWAEVGGKRGPIEVDALAPQSTTWETFREVLLESRELFAGARRFDDSGRLSDRVAGERSAIGFVGIAWVRSARALAIAERGAEPTLPSPFTVASEAYPLSRRLYLYSRPRPRSDAPADFISFTLSDEGQQLVRQVGYVDLSVGVIDGEGCGARCPAEVADVVRGARRLTVDFRFRGDGAQLDSRAARDLDRLVAWRRSTPAGKILLLGFGGDRGRSQQSAALVAAELESRGVKPALVTGFGGVMPLSSRAGPAGDWRNRRVEVWVASR